MGTPFKDLRTPIKDQSRRSLLVGDQILWLRRNYEATPMHVIKLAFLCHGWMLGLTGKALIYESVEAWLYGPVIPSLYHRWKSFGGEPVETELVDLADKFDKEENALMRAVLNAYSDYNARELSNITHQEGSPWDIVCHDPRYDGVGGIIPNELIEKFYGKLAQAAQKK